ncbi:MAG: hypothetical protein SPH93_01150 [Clostridium sp.]|uniref:hypothetical protein n=1 Tax=Clostridium sp. TaxID=1506 RepID=UPI0025C27289|nr:hypothetical protein [Clostridium sp.]MDY6226276.1 hypothetical protein [Clostridium sp.]
MKKYAKNKNFISANFIDKIQRGSDEKNNKLILLLLIVNIFIIPKSISIISNELEQNKSVSVTNINTPKEIYKDRYNDKLVLIINSINNFKKIKMENSRGVIEVDSMEEVVNIEEESDFKIKSVDIKDNIIIVEVEL